MESENISPEERSKQIRRGLSEGYGRYIGKKVGILLILAATLVVLSIISITVGAVNVSIDQIFNAFFYYDPSNGYHIIIMNVRLPRILMGIVAGGALAISGTVMQSVLRNPLSSPYTLGLSQAAAFGAAFGILFFGAGQMQSNSVTSVLVNNPYVVTIFAFIFALVGTAVIIALSAMTRVSPEAMVLAGVAIGSIFSAGITALQYVANSVQLSAMVYWTFGDLGRSTWDFFWLLLVVSVPICLYFYHNRWNYNALDAGEETAKGLGVEVSKVRIIAMVLSSLLAAVVVSLMGIIGFIGLLAPHMVRRVIGSDNRFVIPGSIILGGIILMGSDTLARTLFAPQIIPVGVITSFLGGPLFIYLLIRGYRK